MPCKSDNLYEEILKRIDRKGVWDMIVVDGVVGVGKSTLMGLIAKRGYVSFEEPVVDNPILEKFYYDRERYSFPLQVFFLNKRFKHIKEASSIANSVMDRSIYGDVIFAKMLCDKGEMSLEEFDLYKELLENMLEHVQPPKLMVYLEVSVDEAMSRIKKRGRDYEQVVERAYWEKLNDEYRKYFYSYDVSPILKINVDGLDFENNEKDREYVLGLIEQQLREIEEK
ncbi:deoxyadenosine kinase [Clostridium folliculivorans]|uniref:Deoxyadenosine kinase n=2 Tax=Clostridium folliculivorans TaxID=2886038 RepID=A0A9W5Y6Q7_9CLOT|nr:deoxynucleoside kinase [Clostridium folliculivorans]GKU27402.1 deoxyadenosine kinase [Clostridium folliculivorans]GKU32253.1 deoxyadenosine kinase [Clostridium folliculivorans]